MRERLSERLEALKAEFERGQTRLAQVEEEAIKLRETLLRISGAIQVLTEELGADGAAKEDGPAAALPIGANGGLPEGSELHAS